HGRTRSHRAELPFRTARRARRWTALLLAEQAAKEVADSTAGAVSAEQAADDVADAATRLGIVGRGGLALVRDQTHDDRSEDRQKFSEVDPRRLLGSVQLGRDILRLVAEHVFDDLVAVGLVDFVDLLDRFRALVLLQRPLYRRRAFRTLGVLGEPADEDGAALLDGLLRLIGRDAELGCDVVDRHLPQDVFKSHG